MKCNDKSMTLTCFNEYLQKECDSREYFLIEDTLVQAPSTLSAATEFDAGLRSIGHKIVENELALFKLEKRLMVLEAQNKSLQNIYASLKNSLPLKILRLLKKIIVKFKKFIFLRFRYILTKLISMFPKLNILSLLKCAKNNNQIISIIVYLLRKVGMERQAYMLPLTFKKLNKFQDSSVKINSKLMNNYKLSLFANKIYENIKSRPSK